MLARSLPPDLPAAVFVVLHVAPTGKSVLPDILNRANTLPAAHATDGEEIRHGRIYVAPPDNHMLVERDRVRLSRGPRENGHRPAIDPLFRSAARAYEGRVVGVVLSGVLDDGSAGLLRVKVHGGATIVQDPDDALYPAMPEHAIAHVDPDRVLALAQIGEAIVGLSKESAADGRASREASVTNPYPERPEDGSPSGLTCPECGGALWEVDDHGILRFACHVGHAYSTSSILAEQGEAVEGAVWAALRTLEERASLCRRLALRLEGKSSATRFGARAAEAEHHAGLLRDVIEHLTPATEDEPIELAE